MKVCAFWLLGCVWLAASGTVVAGEGAAGDDARRTAQVFGTGVEVVALNVTVTDMRERYVRGLTQEDFVVFEDGVARPVELFGAGEVPLDVAVLLDTSESVRPRMARIHAAARAFLHTLGPDDRAMVVGFSNRIQVLQGWTTDRDLLNGAVRRANPAGGTSLFTALYIALKTFGQAHDASQLRRQAVVVLSDGEDTTSLVSFDDVLGACRRGGVSVYTIRLAREVELPRHVLVRTSTAGVTGDYAMGTIARETGGRTFTLRGLQDLESTYRTIAEELSHQYVLGFLPEPGTATRPYRQVSVLVPGRSDTRARTRPGYVAEPAGGGTAETRSMPVPR